MSDEQVGEQVQKSEKAPAAKWGDPISAERQAELRRMLDSWDTPDIDRAARRGPFYSTNLNGADVSWLKQQSRYDEKKRVDSMCLQGAILITAHLEGALLDQAHLESASLAEAHLEGANLAEAHLEDASLEEAHLEGAFVNIAHLERAILSGAHLEGVELIEAHLEGALLDKASFDKASRLNDAKLVDAFLDQVIFDNTNLTVVDWSLVSGLGDERRAREHKDEDGKSKTRERRLDEYKAAVRANRVLSVNLQAQGLAEDGNRFAYHAQVLQRPLLRLQRKYIAYLFSWLLAGLAGYGYRLRRIFIVYGLAVLLFAAGYFLAGGITPQAHLSLQQQALDALQVSLNAIHGRVFFTQLGLDTLQSWLATLESIVGIVIEGVFVAMLIQRFFAR